MSHRLAQTIANVLLPHPPDVLGVAVSGGSDSMALLSVLHQLASVQAMTLKVVTIDHQLRPEAAVEAATVAGFCETLGLSHDTLRWSDWNGDGNLQEAARRARYGLISDWAQGHGIDTVALGHTADDQAETVLMRLSRRAGVDGLSAMQTRTSRHGITWLRPLLGVRRQILRSHLTRAQITWSDDPSNEDLSYDRIKARKALDLLEPLGIDVASLSDIAAQMAEARSALEWQSFRAAKDIARVIDGAVVFEDRGWRVLPNEVRRRLIRKAVTWVSGSEYGPRRDAVTGLIKGLATKRAGTADGCHIRPIGGQIWVFREWNAVRRATAATSDIWDKRWILTPPRGAGDDASLHVRALGPDGIDHCPNWRATGLPHDALFSTPSVWRGADLVAAPHAGAAHGWRAQMVQSEESFFAALLTH